MPDLTSVIQIGCSPRATLGLVAASRALALIHGRDYVLPTDVQAVAKDVMAHRLVLGFDAVADNISPTQVVERIIAMVPPPTPVWKDEQRQQGQDQHRYQPAPGSQPSASEHRPNQPGFDQPASNGQHGPQGQQSQQGPQGQQGPNFPPPGQQYPDRGSYPGQQGGQGVGPYPGHN